MTVQAPLALVGTVSASPSIGVGRLTPTLSIGGFTPVASMNLYYRIDCGNGQGGKNGALIPSLPAGPIPNATHIHCTYETPGSYTISVKWFAENLPDSDPARTTVTVLPNTAPTPFLVAAPASGPPPLATAFTVAARIPTRTRLHNDTIPRNERSKVT